VRVCPDRLRLTSSMSTAAKHYAQTVAKLNKEGPTCSADAYRDLLAVAEDAQRSCILARTELESHMSDHQCRSPKQALSVKTEPLPG
jgi:hypothetical protein